MPQTIWAYPEMEFGYHHDKHQTWSEDREYEFGTEYRRADLPATDAQALANPKVQALVEAAKAMARTSPYWPDDMKPHAELKAALVALEVKG